MNKNVPNRISIFRLVLVFVFLGVFFSGMEHRMAIATVIFVIAGISDVVDGYIARKYNLISNFGKIMDPLADKLMQFTVAVCLATLEPALWWVPVFLASKELLMLFGAAKLMRRNNVVVRANWAGKLASTIYFAVFLTLMLFVNITPLVKQILCSLFVLFSIMAFVIYVIDFLKVSKKQQKKENDV